jgi:YaiO family outer membrane protein
MSFGSGPPFATTKFYIEGDATVHKGLQVAFGAGDSGAVGLGATRSLHAGATLYKGDGYVSFAYTPGWSQVIGYTQGYTLSMAFGHPGKTTETIFLGTGTESDVSLVNPSNPSIAGERETGATLMIKHWINPRLGYRLGYEYGTLNHAAGGQIYQRNTFDLGVFTNFEH